MAVFPPPWTFVYEAFMSLYHLFPGFLAVFVGTACLFTPYEVSFDDGRVMLFYIASRGVGVFLILVGAFALWQAPTILLPGVV